MCKESKRQTINADDVLKALDEMEFSEFVEPLRTSLQGQYCYIRPVIHLVRYSMGFSICRTSLQVQSCYCDPDNNLIRCSMGLSICEGSKMASGFTHFYTCLSFNVLVHLLIYKGY